MAEPTLREWLRDQPFSLAMSAGFFGFFAHAGVLTVLEEESLIPQRVYGASAGALVTGLWAGGVSSSRMKEELLRLKRSDFWDPWPGPGILRGRLFRAKLDELLAGAEFSSCRIPAAISVFDVRKRSTEVIHEGKIASAIHASCALPVLFHPVRVGGKVFSDGGILDRPGLAGAANGERVLYHHLASKSPWRRPGSPALQVPERENTATLLVENVTRVNPFSLGLGRQAYDQAARAMRFSLERPLTNGLAKVSA